MTHVLLLNASFEPLTAIPVRRAVVLVLGGKAEAVEEGGTVIHSATLEVPIPSVIRLRYFVHIPYRGRVPLTRRGVLRRDEYRCAYCGNRAETIDHVVPRSRGGQHVWENVVAACKAHNMRKGNSLLSELGWSLHTAPAAPKGPRWLAGLDRIDPVWVPYLGDWAAA